MFTWLKKLLFPGKTKEQSPQPAQPPPDIDFPDEAPQIADNYKVIFAIKINGIRRGGMITYETLQEMFECTGADLLECFNSNRGEIEHIARKIILKNPDHKGVFTIYIDR